MTTPPPTQPSDALGPLMTPQAVNPLVAPTNLTDLVPALKRELAVPGAFATIFPTTQDADLAGSLADSFANAQLDGFFSTQVVDPTALTVTPGLSSGGMALVILYAAIRTIKAQLRNLATLQKYDAGGGVGYEVSYSSNVLVTELKDFQERRNQLLALVLRQSRNLHAVYVSDGYLIRSYSYFPAFYGAQGSFHEFELGGYGLGGAGGLLGLA